MHYILVVFRMLNIIYEYLITNRNARWSLVFVVVRFLVDVIAFVRIVCGREICDDDMIWENTLHYSYRRWSYSISLQVFSLSVLVLPFPHQPTR